MRRLIPLVVGLSLAMAQQGGCSSVPPQDVPNLSTRPVISLRVTPEGLMAPGSLSVQANVPAYALQAILSVRGERRWDDYGPVTLASWGGSSPARTVQFGPLSGSNNGIYTFTLSATLCYRLNGVLTEEAQSREVRVPVYIPWRLLPRQGNTETTNVAWFLWREAEATNYIELSGGLRGGEPMSVEGLVTGLDEGVRGMLRDYLVKGYLNQGNYPPACGFFCYSIAPVKLRLFAVQGVGGLFQQGWASLGFYGGMRDSRSFELGTKGVSGVLIVRGYRHDYILLSARGDFGDEVQVVEMPKGGAELFRKALSLEVLQTQAREVRP